MEKQWKSETFKDILNNPVSVCTKNFNSLKSRCRWAFYLIGFIAHDFCDFLNIWTFWNICDHNNIMWKGVGGLLSPQAHLSLGLPLYLIVFQWSRRGWRSAWKIREHFFLDTLNDKKKVILEIRKYFTSFLVLFHVKKFWGNSIHCWRQNIKT